MPSDETTAPDSQAQAQPTGGEATVGTAPVAEPPRATKFCSRCGGKIDERAVVCPLCGCQVEQLAPAASPNVVINNTNTNMNTQQVVDGTMFKKPKNKWVALLLCFFLGVLGGHKFYEGKIGTGVLYLFTAGLFFIGPIVDFIILLFKPNPYYV